MLRTMYKLVIKRKAQKQFDALQAKDRARILIAFNGLREQPFGGKRLNGELHGLFALRVWPFRILYTIERKIITVTVLAIGHRKDVYHKV